MGGSRIVRYVICAALLAGSATCAVVGAASQEKQAGGQEGVQQQGYQNMTPAQRAADTRAFLGLEAAPDKAAAERGAPLFAKRCADCHGKNARGAMAPSLITSDLVLADDHGEHLVPFLKQGIPGKGMPSFSRMSDEHLKEIAEFLHLQVEDVANRGTYQVLNILVGDASKGKTYVDDHCRSCHAPEAFAHIAGKYRSSDQLQRNWIWPARDAVMTADVKTASGTIEGRVMELSDFQISLVDEAGKAHTIDRGPGTEVEIHDPLAAHGAIVMTLTNDDMHNVTAYLETLK